MKRPEIGIGAVILNETGDQVLLLLRKKDPEKNTWSIPGGKVELFETLENAVIRETKEETNLDVSIVHLLNTSETIDEKSENHWISLIYLCKAKSYDFKLVEPDKAKELKWFSLNELPENIACFSKEALEIMKKNR